MIPYGKQDISQADINTVIEVLKSDWLTQGPMVPLFEEAIAKYVNANYVAVVNSATSALHIACLALDMGPGDWLWTSPNSFVASANAALFCGAKVDFVDIDPRTFNMCPIKLGEKLEHAKVAGTLPKVVMPVHFAGQSCDMSAIFKLSKNYGFRVIEDASHAIGGKYNGQMVGGCQYSDITVFSFHPVKIITTGEGGATLTNDKTLADRMKRYRTHGITSEKSLMMPRSHDEIWNYQQIDLGFNYRMTDIQAALGISQLKRIDGFIRRRRAVAESYDRAFKELPIATPFQSSNSLSSYHLYVVRIDKSHCGIRQQKAYDLLHKSGIQANLHYIPIYRQPFFEAQGFREGYCPESERHHKEALSLPIYPGIDDEHVRKVIQAVESIFTR